MAKLKSSIFSFVQDNWLFVAVGLLLVVAYFFSRFLNLTLIPVFADEAIYIRWAQVMRAVPSLRFIPLSDGKQPLFMWLIIPFLKVFPDPLVAGRMVSVLAGFGTMAGIFALSLVLFKKKEIGFFASLLYVISPFSLFFDRLALADGLLSFLGVWVLLIAVLLLKLKRLDLAMIGGMILGLALLTKSPALFFALLLPATLLLFDFSQKDWLLGLVKLTFLWGVVYFLAFAIYNILRLGPEFHMIALRNKDYVFSLAEIINHPFKPFWGNFKAAISWLWILLTPVTFLLGWLGAGLALKKNFRSAAFVLLAFFGPLCAQSALAKVYTARYILFLVPFFLVLAGFGLADFFDSLKSKKAVIGFLILVFVFPLYQLGLLLSFPQQASLPAEERRGYLEIWTAGYGIREAADYLKMIAKDEKVLVGTEGYFGTLPDGLQIYLEKAPNITIIGLGQPIREISSKLTNALADNRVFLLVNDSRLEVVDSKKIKLINQFPKAKNLQTGSQENLLLFEISK
ncbi:MAG TPA: glycosyltransferase family 39 protein [Clostridia bacterium]|nr:glycosyltransferase family 39 protein [Clostridia bacterium]